MLKKILIGVGILALFLAVAFIYLNNRNRSRSPPDTAHLDVNGLHVEISYSRPSVRGRVIFGTEDEGALQPYGSYWRLGANEATTITVSQDVTFNGMPLKAGSYSLYAIPGADSFQIGVNTETGQWGAWEPDFSKNVFVTEVPVTRPVVPVEQFTTRIEEGSDGAVVYFRPAKKRNHCSKGVNGYSYRLCLLHEQRSIRPSSFGVSATTTGWCHGAQPAVYRAIGVFYAEEGIVNFYQPDCTHQHAVNMSL